MERLLAATGDRGAFVREMRALKERKLIGVAVERLEYFVEEIPLSVAEPFITALFDIGDELGCVTNRGVT
jgi:hypothetical protein